MLKLDDEGRYQFVRKLGSGGFGAVFRAIDTVDHKEVAIKRLDLKDTRGREETLRQHLKEEDLSHRGLAHQNVAALEDVYLIHVGPPQPQSLRFIALKLELANGGSLLEHIRDLWNSGDSCTEERARWFMQQLVAALDYLHSSNVWHRDLKLDNTLIQVDPRYKYPLLKLCDFGLSERVAGGETNTLVGTLGYCAPELLLNPAGTPYGPEIDIWCAGIILYAMLVNRLAFGCDGTFGPQQPCQQLQQLSSSTHWKNLWLSVKQCSAGVQDLLQGMLEVDPEKRFTLDDVKRHAWVQEDRDLNPRAAFVGEADYEQKCGRPVACLLSAEHLTAIVNEALAALP